MPFDEDRFWSELEAGLPAWAQSIAARLMFFARERADREAVNTELTTTLDALRVRLGEPGGGDRMLADFQRACLRLFADAVNMQTDLAGIREDLHASCRLALTALDSDCDDRPLLARESALEERLGVTMSATQLSAIRVPGRVVWLAAMSAQVPDEEGAATAMLVNDLAAVDADLPLKAFQTAVRS